MKQHKEALIVRSYRIPKELYERFIAKFPNDYTSKVRELIEASVKAVNNKSCSRCNSTHIVKLGTYPTIKDGKKQRYRCESCGHTFT